MTPAEVQELTVEEYTAFARFMAESGRR